MTYTIEYFHRRVLAEIESWPADIVADYARIAELLMQHGPSLRLPHSRAFGSGLFELRPRGRAGIGRAFYCFWLINASSYCTRLSRSRNRHRSANCYLHVNV